VLLLSTSRSNIRKREHSWAAANGGPLISVAGETKPPKSCRRDEVVSASAREAQARGQIKKTAAAIA
jgi:hypothetical protein